MKRGERGERGALEARACGVRSSRAGFLRCAHEAFVCFAVKGEAFTRSRGRLQSQGREGGHSHEGVREVTVTRSREHEVVREEGRERGPAEGGAFLDVPRAPPL